jgi:hypothetical protein
MMEKDHSPAPLIKFRLHPAWHRRSLIVRGFVVVLLLLLAIRIALPFAIESYVNRKLNEAPDYYGHIGTIRMRLWHGGYRIHEIDIQKKTGDVKSPLFSAQEIDLVIEWAGLFHGSLVGEIDLQQPRINIVSGPTEAETQNGKDQDWNQILKSLFPFNFNRVSVTNGEIHFQNQYSKPPVDIYLSKLSALATNLNNARDVKQKLPSGLVAHATTIGGGLLDLNLKLNVLKTPPAYEINCGLTNVDLTALNTFLRAYGKFDVARGNFSIYTSVAADNGSFEGYFKVFFQNLDVFAWEKERQKNILEVFWQAVVGGVAEVLKNHPKDQLAAKVPISGSYSNSTVNVWVATGTVLQNAFIHALVPKLDQTVTVDQVEKKAE